MSHPGISSRVAGLLILALAIAACAGRTASPSAAPSPTTRVVPTDPPITLSAPATATAGATFQVGWTGAETSGDFFVIVPAGATDWTETPDSPYVNATVGNPATLTAPKTPGSYEIWFMKGNMETVLIIKARAPLTVQ